MTEWYLHYGGRGVMIYFVVRSGHGQSEVALAFCRLLGSNSCRA